MNVDLIPCCKPRLLEQESWGTARNSRDMLKTARQKNKDKKQYCEDEAVTRDGSESEERGEKLNCRCALRLILIN